MRMGSILQARIPYAQSDDKRTRRRSFLRNQRRVKAQPLRPGNKWADNARVIGFLISSNGRVGHLEESVTIVLSFGLGRDRQIDVHIHPVVLRIESLRCWVRVHSSREEQYWNCMDKHLHLLHPLMSLRARGWVTTQ